MQYKTCLYCKCKNKITVFNCKGCGSADFKEPVAVYNLNTGPILYHSAYYGAQTCVNLHTSYMGPKIKYLDED